MSQIVVSGSSEYKLVVMRHGEGTHTSTRTWDSTALLTDKGREQAQKVAEKLLSMGINKDNVAIAYVSPLGRTQQTAQELVKGGVIDEKKIEIEERVKEPNMGRLEGTSVVSTPGKDHWDLADAKEYGGELLEEVQSRVAEFYTKLSKNTSQGHVIVVTHGIPSRELIALHTEERTKLTVGEIKVMPLNSHALKV